MYLHDITGFPKAASILPGSSSSSLGRILRSSGSTEGSSVLSLPNRDLIKTHIVVLKLGPGLNGSALADEFE